MSNPILGRGLSSLLPGDNKESSSSASGLAPEISPAHLPPPAKTRESIFYVDREEVEPNPHQPRRDFDGEALGELAESIRAYGILQPLIVTKHEHPNPRGQRVSYEIIAGERRWRAAALAGLKHVPIIIRETKAEEKLEVALVENIQRYDLNPLEEAAAFKKLTDEFGLSQEAIAQKLGKSRAAVANTMRLLSLPQDVQRAILEGKVTEGHARSMLGLKDPVRQLALLKEIIERRLTVREVEEIVQTTQVELGTRKERAPRDTDPEVREFESRLEEALGTKVALRGKPTRGKIVVEFYSREDLQRILEKLSSQEQKISN